MRASTVAKIIADFDLLCAKQKSEFAKADAASKSSTGKSKAALHNFSALLEKRYPEKWKQYTELNESYVKAGKFTPDEFAKHQSK